MIKKMGLTTKILVALTIGIIVGIIVYSLPGGVLKDTILINGIFELTGQLFLRAIMMVVVPLVFVSLVTGTASMSDIQKLGRVGGKTVGFYLVTTAIAAIISLGVGFLVNPGIGLNMGAIEIVATTAADKPPMVQVLYEMIPRNAIDAMAKGNMLQIIVFAILTGIAISLIGEKGSFVLKFFDGLNEIVMKLVEIVMKFAPIGVFGLIAKTFATVGYAALIPLAKYIGAVYIGLIIHAFVVYGGMFKGMARGLSLRTFYKKFFPAMSVAFSTASSAATIPVSLDICENQLGIDKGIASFTIPLGSTVNMDGTAIMQGIAAIFVAQVYNVPMTFPMMLTIVLTATLASIGAAGVPGAGPIMLAMVLQSVGLPLEGVGLIMGVDRLVDMGRTALNVTGDAICTTIIARSEGELDESIYNSQIVEKAK